MAVEVRGVNDPPRVTVAAAVRDYPPPAGATSDFYGIQIDDLDASSSSGLQLTVSVSKGRLAVSRLAEQFSILAYFARILDSKRTFFRDMI